MPAGQAFALGGLVVDWCAAAGAALGWIEGEGSWLGAHVGSRKEKARAAGTGRAWGLG